MTGSVCVCGGGGGGRGDLTVTATTEIVVAKTISNISQGFP